MYLHKYFLSFNTLAIIIIFLFGCSRNDRPSNISLDTWDFKEQITPSINVIRAGMELIEPIELISLKNHVVAYDPKNTEFTFFCYDKEFGAKSFGFGRKGQGPGEFSNASHFKNDEMVNNDTTMIEAYDSGRKRRINFVINDNGKVSDKDVSFFETTLEYHNIKTISFGNDYLLKLCSRSDSGNKRFSLLDSNFRVVDRFIDFPFYSDFDQFTENERYRLTSSVIIEVNPSRTRLVFGTKIGTQLEIFDISKLPEKMERIIVSNIELGQMISLNLPFKTKNFSIPMPNRNSPMGFRDLFVTDNYIYGVHMGRKWDNLYECCDAIKVFDLNGNEIRQYNISAPVLCIAVEEREEKIYSIIYNKATNQFDFVMFNL